MKNRTGMMPVFGGVLLLTLSLLSLRAWTGGDLNSDLQNLSSHFSIENIDRELAALRDDLRCSFGLPRLQPTVVLNKKLVVHLDHEILLNSDGVDMGRQDYQVPADVAESLNRLKFKKRSRVTLSNPNEDHGSHSRLSTTSEGRALGTASIQFGSKSARVSIEDLIQRLYDPLDEIRPIRTLADLGSINQSVSLNSQIRDNRLDAIHPNSGSFEFVSASRNSDSNRNAIADSTTNVESPNVERQSNAWVAPHGLIKQIKAVESVTFLSEWSQSTIKILRELESLDSIADPSSVQLFKELNQAIAKLGEIDAKLPQLWSPSEFEQDDLPTSL
ncbi:MAG: hypothetical protein AAGA30_11785, partial [Planctomycetota bacterium]